MPGTSGIMTITTTVTVAETVTDTVTIATTGSERFRVGAR